MAHDINDNDLDNSLRLLESSKFKLSLGNPDEAKKEALSSLGRFNNLLVKYNGDALSQRALKRFGEDALKYYDNITVKGRSVFGIELSLIWLSSRIHGNFYPPIEQLQNQIANTDETRKFRDHDPVLSQLSDSQQLYFKEFQRAQVWEQDWLDFESLGDLHQDFVENCSFVSSCLSVINHDPRTLYDCITPHQKSGRYGIKFFLNGCARLVIIDDLLPQLSHRVAFMRTSSNDLMIWPALLEKAYLKVMGFGYDFKGSTIANDTFMLTSWIPEMVEITNGKLNEWDVIYDNFKNKKLLLGIGTEHLSEDACRELNLVSNHDYSIIDIRIHEGEKQLLIKNPWLVSGSERAKWYNEYELTVFKTLYLNWDPAIFRYHTKSTFIYKKDEFFENYYNNPQFTVTNPTVATMDLWLLLEKHLSNSRNIDDKGIVQNDEEFLTLHVFETDGEKILIKNKSILSQGVFTNSRLYLTKFKLLPGQTCTIVAVSRNNGNFTISTYNDLFDIKISKSKFKHQYQQIIEGEWNYSNSGGNWIHSSYIDNPQYNINLSRTTNLLIGLFTPENVYINFHLFHGNGSKDIVRRYDSTKLLVNEKYNLHNQVYEISLPAGDYKLILSTYEQNSYCNHLLFLNSSESVKIDKLSTKLGLFLKSYEFQWKNLNRFKLSFRTNRTSNVKIHLHTLLINDEWSSYRPAIRASIFRNGLPVVINEGFDDNLYGIFIDENLAPGDYILLIERFECGNSGCLVEMGSDNQFELLME